MKTIKLACVGLLIGLCACGDGNPPASSSKAISDVYTMSKRGDGLFDVVCRDGHREVVAAVQIQANNVCPVTPQPPPQATHKAKGNERSFPLQGNMKDQVLMSFGQGLWEGYVSFKVYVTNDSDDFITITDGVGGQWKVNGGNNSESFTRLILPVIITGNSDGAGSSEFYLSSLEYEVTATHPMTIGLLSGRSDQYQILKKIGEDIAGSKISGEGILKLYKNYTTLECAQIAIVDSHNTMIKFDAAQADLKFTNLIAPLSILVRPTCQATRLPQPENSQIDFEFLVPSLIIGDPI